MEKPSTPGTRPSSEADRAGSGGDMRALQALGTRVATVASEIQRLRAENVALAARVADLEGSGQPSLPMPTVPGGEDLRERIDAFIDAIDHALRLGDGRSMGA